MYFYPELVKKLRLLLVVFVVGLAACGGGDTNPTVTSPDETTTGDVPPGDDNPDSTTGADTVRLTITGNSAVESEGYLVFTVTLDAASSVTVSVEYRSFDGEASAGADYQAVNGQLTFLPGETSQQIRVPLVDDTASEASESLHVQLQAPVNARLGETIANGLILDNDSLAASDEFNPDWGRVGVFSDANTCKSCHRASTDLDPAIPTVMRYPLTDAGEDVSPAQQWQHSMMAHSYNDPYYQAAVQDETRVFPHLAGFIEDKCLTCHTPMARTHAHQSGTNLIQDATCGLSDGCYRLESARRDMHAREGISCTLCHQVREENLGTSASFSGNYSIAAAADLDAFRIFGPYQNPHTGGSNAMQNNSGYTPMHGNHMSSSAHCASCHTLYTPALDVENGAPTGISFLEQGPYLEWQNSVYASGTREGRQCQECHMAEPEPEVYASRIAITPAGQVNQNWPERSPFYTHSMVGGNTYMLEVLQAFRTVLGIEDTTTMAGFDEKIAQTRDLLENRTAQLAISGITQQGDELNVDVQVTNNTGHKLPTGFPSRRAWIYLRVSNAAGQTLFESGAADARGRISTDATRLQPECLAIDKVATMPVESCYEPHRDVISEPSQVAIYEAVLGDSNRHITHVLLHANSYLKDNRIPPQGFTNSTAVNIEQQTLPAGTHGDADFNQLAGSEGSGTDTVHYRIPLAGQDGPYTVEARLLYQSVQPAFVKGLHSDAELVNRFKVMYEQLPPRAETLASTSAIY